MQSLKPAVEAVMPPLFVPHEETFARALARGVCPSLAGAEAGYGRHVERARERAARPDILARARALQDARRETPEHSAQAAPRFPPLSDEDWLAKYGRQG